MNSIQYNSLLILFACSARFAVKKADSLRVEGAGDASPDRPLSVLAPWSSASRPPIAFVDEFGDTMTLLQPFAEIDEFTTLTAKGPPGIVGRPFNRFFAGWTLYGVNHD